MERGRVLTRTCALLAMLAGVVLLSFFKVNDVDVFWQLKVGERVLATGETVAQQNAFSSIFPDQPFYNPEWLFQVLLATAYKHGGWPGVAALKLLLVALLAALLHARLIKVRDAPALAAALTVAALAAMRSRLTERPQLASLIFFALMLLLLEEGRRGRRWHLWLLPPLFALWSNVHGELLLGILVIFGTAAGEWLQRRRAGIAGAISPQRFAALGLGCLAASLLNPGGARILYHPFAHFTLGALVQIVEFSFSSPLDVPLFWVLLAALLIALIRRGRPVEWATVLPAAGLAILAARYRREVPYFVLAALPLLLQVPRGDARSRWSPRAETVGASILAAGALLWALRFDQILIYRWGWGIDNDIFPVAAADFIERERLPPRLYNHYNVGGYLLYRLSKPYGVFQDSRTSAYPDEFMATLHAQHGGVSSLGVLERYGVNTALIYSFEAGFLLPKRDWSVVFWDDRHAVLVRRAQEHAPLLARLEYRHYLPWGDATNYDDPRELDALAAEMRRNQRERAAPSAAVAADYGIVLGRLQRYDEAGRELMNAVALDPRNARAWAYLGLVQAQRGEEGQARESWRRALALDAAQEVAIRGLERAARDATPQLPSR